MHMYAKCDLIIPCGSKVMNIFTRRTHIVIIVHVQGSCNIKTLYRWMKKKTRSRWLFCDICKSGTISDSRSGKLKV